MPSRTASVRSLAFAVAAIGTMAATAQAAPKSAASAPAAAQPVEPTPPAGPSEAAGSPAATVSFDRQSVEINAAARGALDTLAQVLTARGVHQVELRGYATGDDDDARKLALVRTLAVRMYLIDQGVKARIEVMAQATPAKSGAKERVDIMAPLTQ